MVTEYELKIGGDTWRLTSADIKNWDEIKFKLTRSGFDGVMRSFTSQFEFVGDVADALYAAYLTDGIFAKASIAVFTLSNRWHYEKQFECDLDFTSVGYENGIFSISSVDNSFAALIKSNKGTDYDLEIGKDIVSDATFAFDRLNVKESITYEITGGESDSDTGVLTVDSTKPGNLENNRLYVGIVGDEISVGRAVDFNDDQTTDAGSMLFSAMKELDVELEYNIEEDTSSGDGTSALIYAVVVAGENESSSYINTVGSSVKTQIYPNDADDLVANYPIADNKASYAIIDGVVWAPYNVGDLPRAYWGNTGKTKAEYFRRIIKGKITLSLKKGNSVYIRASKMSTNVRFCLYSSSFAFSWITKGEACTINAFKPVTVLRRLLDKAGNGEQYARASISGFDSRLADTLIFASESARNLDNAKLSSSFTNFVDWMSAVFGYTYVVGERKDNQYKYIKPFGSIIGTNYTLITAYPYAGEVDPVNIAYMPYYNSFVYYDGSGFYRHFDGSTDYNDDSENARTDTVFKSGDKLYCIEKGRAVRYYECEESIGKPYTEVNFLHRSELFGSTAVKHIDGITEVKLSTDSNVIYSKIEAGYDKKDYDSINGRDEFNFDVNYTTGCSLSSKTLSLKSKYRADCYGIEFAVQKRGEDTTDSDSDKDVYFVHVTNENGILVPDRSVNVDNALSDTVFNGAFSPLSCIDANALYIAVMAQPLTLTFASAGGNSDVVVGGRSFSDAIYINEALATCSQLQFSTDDMDLPADLNALIEVEHDGFLYQGFISEVEMRFAKSETVSYKIIVKSVTQC